MVGFIGDHRRGLFAASTCIVVAAIALLIEIGNILALSAPIAAPDAIVVLGSHEWERLPLAAHAARANPKAVVLLTVPLRLSTANCYQCGDRADWLVHAGVKRERVVLLYRKVQNTHDEATATFSYAATRNIHSLLVVTSPYHGRRALATFRSIFAQSPVQVGVDTSIRQAGIRPNRWWLSAYDRWYVGYESLAILMYSVRYGISPFM